MHRIKAKTPGETTKNNNLRDKAQIEKGIGFFRAGKFSDALSEFNAVITRGGHYTAVYYYRAYTYYQLANYQDAIDDCNKVLRFSESFDNLWLHAMILFKLGHYQPAIEDYNKLITFNSNKADVHYNRGIAYLKLKQFTNASIDFIGSIKIDPTKSDVYYDLGVAFHKLKKTSFAIDKFFKALLIELRAGQAAHSKRIGRCYKALKVCEESDVLHVVADYPEADINLLATHCKDEHTILGKLYSSDELEFVEKAREHIRQINQLASSIRLKNNMFSQPSDLDRTRAELECEMVLVGSMR